ncbi:gem-associated protein 8 isoform X2 [Hoplias malabaricus]|uniref:gem-associated protein 8 isoform X2 n=1 Tax=Hoplias malabaricus TaxID=27720 RepID=UPI003463508A
MASQWDMDAWYAHPVYARYWQHYQQAMSWQQRHRRAYSKALQAAYGPALYPVFPAALPRYSDWHSDESEGRAKRQGRREVEALQDDERESEDEEETQSSDESEIECNVSSMDISAELRQFFAQTEQHREELIVPFFQCTPLFLAPKMQLELWTHSSQKRNNSRWRQSGRKRMCWLTRIYAGFRGAALSPQLSGRARGGARR